MYALTKQQRIRRRGLQILRVCREIGRLYDEMLRYGHSRQGWASEVRNARRRLRGLADLSVYSDDTMSLYLTDSRGSRSITDRHRILRCLAGNDRTLKPGDTVERDLLSDYTVVHRAERIDA